MGKTSVKVSVFDTVFVVVSDRENSNSCELPTSAIPGILAFALIPNLYLNPKVVQILNSEKIGD